MPLTRYWLLLPVCILAPLPAARLAADDRPSDWPQFRGPGGRGVSTDAGLPVTWSANDNVVWKTELPGPGTSQPVIVGSKIFLTCYTGYAVPGKPRGDQSQLKLHLLRLDRDTGRVVEDTPIDPTLPEQPTIRDDHGYASSTPAVDAERVYAFFGKSGVMAFDHAGKLLWRESVGDGLNGWGSAASPLLVGDLVVVNASVESERLVALDRKTGKEVWHVDGIRESWNTPILVDVPGGGTELVVAILGKILGLNPTTGELLWSCATDIGWYMVPSLVVADGVVYCVGGRSGGGLAVRAGGRGDVTRTRRVWTSKKGSNVTSPIVHGGHLYWMHENQGVAYCADIRTGTLVYEQRVQGMDQVYASPVLADGKLYYVSRTGRTAVLAAKPEYERLAVNTLGDRSAFNASPAVAGGKLYLRSDRHLYCLGRK